jgi:putative ABC transport system permease protein
MRKLLRRLQYWIHHRRHSRDLSEEIEFHRSLKQKELEKTGLPAEEAAAASRRTLGNTFLAAENARGVWIWPWLEQLWQDLVYGARILRRGPAFAVTVILTLALAIGANTAVFSVVSAVLLNQLPYANPERLVMIWERNAESGKNRDPVAPLNFQDWEKETSIFDSVAAYRDSGFVLTGAGEPEQVRTLSTTASLFATLGVDAAIGRTFSEDEQRKGERIVVLTHEFSQRRFGGDQSLVGRSLNLGQNSYLIVGIMPPQFRFPENAVPVDMYSPVAFDPSTDLKSRAAHTLNVIGRLKDGVTIETATARMDDVARRIADANPESNPQVSMLGVHDAYVENVRLGLLVALGAVSCFLLVGCVNVANLKLAQGVARSREIAIRTSLGASRWRIARQLLTESLLLSILGGAAGLVLARWTIKAILSVGPNLFGIPDVALDLRVLVFTFAISIVAGIVFGIVPAVHVFRTTVNEAVKAGGPTARRQSAHSALVVAEVMLSMILLVCAGLMVRTLTNLRSLDYGFRPQNLFSIQLFVSPVEYPPDRDQFAPRKPGSPPAQLSAMARLYNDLVDRVKLSPGIDAAAAVSALPLNPFGIDYDLPVYVDGRPRPRANEAPQADFRIATSDYFETMGIPILRGRGFTVADGPNTPDVIVINDALARVVFDGENPIGRRLVLYGRPREIVGIVGSVRHNGFRVEPKPEMIVPSKQFQQFGGMTLVVRSALDSGSVEMVIKRELRQIGPDLPLSNARTMERLMSDSVVQPRSTTLLLAAFALLGIALASVGIYGVMSYGVTQRTHEIGIRMALGARRAFLIRMFVTETITLLAFGIVCGLGAAFGATHLMRGLLFGVESSDPATYAAAVTVLLVAGLAATYRPVLRATRVHPLIALRSRANRQ